MKKIVMKTLVAGPEGSYSPGQVVSLPDEQAEELVAGGYAQYVKPGIAKEAKKETATAEAPEDAMKKPPARGKAGSGKGKGKGKGKGRR